LNPRWDLRPDPLEALRTGDTAPFEAFVTAETGSFVAFFRRLGASPAEAEDLTQELFLKMFRHAHSYDPKGRFVAYAFRVARNAWVDQRRRAGRHGVALGQMGADEGDPLARLPGAEPELGQALEVREEADRVRAALAALPENQRLVFELGVVQELDYPTIASILKIPVGTVKSRMFYAVRRLREACTDQDGEQEAGA
jgi:RNA polymerase sigma-70 factor (ECF subfamily)